ARRPIAPPEMDLVVCCKRLCCEKEAAVASHRSGEIGERLDFDSTSGRAVAAPERSARSGNGITGKVHGPAKRGQFCRMAHERRAQLDRTAAGPVGLPDCVPGTVIGMKIDLAAMSDHRGAGWDAVEVACTNFGNLCGARCRAVGSPQLSA